MDIDYSPLTEKNSKLIKSELTDFRNPDNLIGSAILSLFIIIIIGSINPVLLLLAPLIFYIMYKYIKKSGDSVIRLSNFAVKNNFRFKTTNKRGKGIARYSLGGVLGNSVQKTAVSSQVIGRYKDFDFIIFCPHTRGSFTVMHVSLKNDYPHIILDNKGNDRLTGSIGSFFGEESRIHLEGNFGDTFKVYAKAPPVDTLRILSPDTMHLILDSHRNFDVEIYKNNLHIISNFNYFDEQEIRNFFMIADNILNKLDRRKATVQAKFDSESKVT